MLLLSCSQLSRGFDAEPLFDDLAFELFSGQRVGLVGPNGVGKTTLLRILAGLDRADTGEVRLHAGARVALLRQQPDFAPGRTLFQEARTALQELVAAHDELVTTAEALASATARSQAEPGNEVKVLAERYDRLNEMLRFHDAYNVDHQVESVLDGLGFREEDYDRAVDTFSGGQQSRLMLAKLLLSAPDVMLLDEPSNHLDIGATRWLEDYLVRQPEAMLIVSHDRYFLNRVVTKVFEMHSRRIQGYPGNFEAYWRLRRERHEQLVKAWEAQQDYLEKQEEYIRRVHYGQLHKQAASRQKQIDRIERLERPVWIDTPRMHFGEVRRTGDIVLQVDGLSKAYDRPLFADLTFTLKRGQRLGIMGPNGCGKTTLLKILLGQETADRGSVQHGHLVEFGYYDQHLKALDGTKTVIRAVWPHDDADASEQAMRNLLGRFGLTGDQVYQTVDKLSGGERSRAALAKLVADGVNVLILDEPTNHLDLWACDALEQALLDFDGTAMVVSHDRYFLNRVVDVLLVFEGEGKVQIIYGNYDMYERMRLLQEPKESPRPTNVETKEDARPNKPAKRKRQYPYRKVEDLEAEIAAEEARLRQLEEALASPDLYREGGKVLDTTQAFEAVKIRLKKLYDHWEEAVELNG
ncbi:MAG: ABC-F family ATP-binding cassette domain-containing protein [Planctomycetes bacterium]|nr:ABC-F family ATP-binding cassette domain-containing protein [Planctomycetota bacterium]